MADYAAHFDPARVLAECEAKRRIVRLHQIAERESPPSDPYQEGLIRGWRDAYNDALAMLALPYADHPEFKEEWSA
ncbi:MAG: hypothetical protein GEV09_28070 [Pseudonocardiaceae bacterium]|nr:hypothetical protein [Pseudonocardiaceae bacterium]